MSHRARTRIHRNPREKLKEPIQVFVSSYQKEFRKIRLRLQARTNVLEASRKLLFVADLTEDYPGNRLKETIDKLLAKCSIFVLIVGRRRSKKWVKYEVDYAISNGIPILAYEYHKKVPNPPAVETEDFVNWLINEAGIIVRGHDLPKFIDADQLIETIANDLLEQVGRSMKHYSDILRTLIVRQERR